jgi:hypothetical protein
MFTRVIPGWKPSPDAYAASVDSFARTCGWLASAGITDDRDGDLWTALVSGLAAQQIADEPGWPPVDRPHRARRDRVPACPRPGRHAMTTTHTDVAVPRIRHGDEADRLATAVYDRLLTVLTDLAPQDWDPPTECTAGRYTTWSPTCWAPPVGTPHPASSSARPCTDGATGRRSTATTPTP